MGRREAGGVGRLEELGMAGGGRGGFVFLCICVLSFFCACFGGSQFVHTIVKTRYMP